MAGINQAKTRKIIRGIFARGKQLKLKPLAAVILDAGGHPLAFEREDGAAPGRFKIAEGKANAAIMMGMPSSALQKRAEEQAYFINAMNGVYGGSFVPVPGGVLVRDKKGSIIGAVGVTGDSSENDAECAMAGIESAGLVGEP